MRFENVITKKPSGGRRWWPQATPNREVRHSQPVMQLRKTFLVIGLRRDNLNTADTRASLLPSPAHAPSCFLSFVFHPHQETAAVRDINPGIAEGGRPGCGAPQLHGHVHQPGDRRGTGHRASPISRRQGSFLGLSVPTHAFGILLFKWCWKQFAPVLLLVFSERRVHITDARGLGSDKIGRYLR